MITTLDHTTLAKIQTQSDMDQFVASMNFKSDTVIIKPNWVEAVKGAHTEAKTLDLFLGSLPHKKIYLVESYTFWRNKKFFEESADSFSSKEAQFNTGKMHWDFFKEGDDWFLKHTGIDKVLKKYNATYVNITNELWVGKESPVAKLPQVLYDLKGSDFVSFAKMKGDADYGATLSIKNIFGLIPAPHRMAQYHGADDSLLEKSVLDTNKIYRPLFNMIYVVDGIYTACSSDWRNKKFDLLENTGLIVGGSDAVQVDDTALKIMNRQLIDVMKNLLPDYQKLFGGDLQSQEIPQDYKIDFPKL